MNASTAAPCLLLAAGFTGLSMSPARADTDNVIVTANRYPVPADRTLVPVSVIDRETIDRSAAADLADLLRQQSGIDVVRAGGPGQQTSLFVRGTESNHVVVLVDGVRINSGSVGLAAIENISPSMVSRIETVKAPRTSLYGEDAIGGVINVITRREPDGSMSLSSGIGDDGRQELGASGAAAIGATHVSMLFHRSDFDDVPVLATEPAERRHDNTTLSARADRGLGEWDLQARFWQSAGTTGYFSPACADADCMQLFNQPLDQNYLNRVTALRAGRNIGADWQTSLETGLTQDGIKQNQSPDFVRTKRWHADWQNDFGMDQGHRIVAGMYVSREDVEAISFGSPVRASNTDVRAIYLEDGLTLGRHGLMLAARYSDNDAFGPNVTWNAEYGFDVTRSLRLNASAGRAVRAPSAYDRFGFGGNTDLGEERSLGLQAGAQWTPAGSAVAVTGFLTNIDDLIEYDFVTGRLRNLAAARILGIEASWAYTGPAWNWRVGGVLQDPRDDQTGQDLYRRPRESATFSISRRAGPARLGVDLLAVGPRDDFAGRLAGYGLASLSGLWTVSEHVAVRARLDNLFDRDYATSWYDFTTRYAVPGRSVYGELTYRLR